MQYTSYGKDFDIRVKKKIFETIKSSGGTSLKKRQNPILITEKQCAVNYKERSMLIHKAAPLGQSGTT